MEKKVQKIRLPGTDLEVSPIGLGTWQFAGGHGINKYIWSQEIPEEIRNGIVKAAIDGGINWFDTAEAYGRGRSERNLASALQSAGMKDDEIIIATKWFPLMRFAGNIRKTIEKRISALEPYSIDLYQIHQPLSFSTTKAQMNAMADLVDSGKIQSVGISNFSKKKMIKAYDALKDRGLQLASNQVQYSLIHRNIEKNGILETAKELGIKIIAWGPLEQGVLSGKFHKDPSLANNVSFVRRRIAPNIKKKIKTTKILMETIEEIANVHEATATQIALNWIINFHDGAILSIPGASKVHHVEQNVGAMYINLSKDEIQRIDEVSREYNKMD